MVTGFVPVDNPRPREEYYKLGDKLCMQPVVKKVFKDYALEDCWMYRFLHECNRPVTWATGDNPEKNTLEYHIVQHQKTDWMLRAALSNAEADVFVWVDYGIYHIPDITVAVINKMLKRAEGEPEISIPGCWDKEPINDDLPCWRFCGGLIVCAREYMYHLDKAMKMMTMNRVLQTGKVTWEVNDLARVEQETELPIRWYSADHNKTMFTGY
jgi:hypothetical protein